MTISGLPSHEEVVSFVERDRDFWEKLLKLSRATLERDVEVAFKVESRLSGGQFYISELGMGNEYSASAGKSTCPYGWSERVSLFGLHSHLGKNGKPKAAIFSIDDLFTYLVVLGSNLSRISQAIGIPDYNLFDEFEGHLLHHEGIVRPTIDSVRVLIYQPPTDIVRPSPKGYDVAKPNNHYVKMIDAIGKGDLDDQQRIVEGLRKNGYLATFLKFETKKGTVLERL